MAPRNHKNWLSTPKVEHISSECYNNYSIYEQEIEQIFAKVWVPMCHTSEMYNDGDFRSTQIAHQNASNYKYWTTIPNCIIRTRTWTNRLRADLWYCSFIHTPKTEELITL